MVLQFCKIYYISRNKYKRNKFRNIYLNLTYIFVLSISFSPLPIHKNGSILLHFSPFYIFPLILWQFPSDTMQWYLALLFRTSQYSTLLTIACHSLFNQSPNYEQSFFFLLCWSITISTVTERLHISLCCCRLTFRIK